MTEFSLEEARAHIGRHVRCIQAYPQIPQGACGIVTAAQPTIVRDDVEAGEIVAAVEFEGQIGRREFRKSEFEATLHVSGFGLLEAQALVGTPVRCKRGFANARGLARISDGTYGVVHAGEIGRELGRIGHVVAVVVFDISGVMFNPHEFTKEQWEAYIEVLGPPGPIKRQVWRTVGFRNTREEHFRHLLPG